MAGEATAGVFCKLFKDVSVCRSTVVTKEFCYAFMLFYFMLRTKVTFTDESVNLESLLVLG